MHLLRRMVAVCSMAVILGSSSLAAAQQAGPPGDRPEIGAGGSATRGAEASSAAMDPVLRAVLFAMAARVLREAAASPDPLAALGDTIERSVSAAATSPQALRTIEALTADALRDAPPELRQALLAFIVSTLKHARRDGGQARSELR